MAVVSNLPSIKHLDEGDVVALHVSGLVETMYRAKSEHNTLLVTERCNSNCLMCSQPPKDIDDIDRNLSIIRRVIPLIPTECKELGISGGEPTLLGAKLRELIDDINLHLPFTHVHILTNGRRFAWDGYACTMQGIRNVTFGIPLYSDYYKDHDYVVQADDAFNQTVIGIHNLARYSLDVEIRVVLHAITIPRLLSLSEFIYRNLPFVEHVAFMGMEHIGYAPHNMDILDIDPVDYKDVLRDSTLYLADRGLNVSVYNLQLCVADEQIWEFCRLSISDWKRDYLDICDTCQVKDQCTGFFSWNRQRPSRGVKPQQLCLEG
ncbi:MAG: His-Xaa-Ser system radical SAM maturase HxsC [Ignavibacteria bacterium]|nr:His-Xaa-Ser system radical SAM maturase HxsC [Ignavibacteria bacterium]